MARSAAQVNVALLKALGVEDLTNVFGATLRMEPLAYPVLTVERRILDGGDVVVRLERLRLGVIDDDSQRPAPESAHG
ncbi:hypothetical protein SNE35_28745 [Paucibacter sp. R3-3]|uniref:Uncharacterized protein n=1 Tax=Roseateles agri TaxID=3098619 RepID=A0ABU5DQC1_9BURK|nr:hypothetical protein [Paucibacter sp. R3-3]MDY0748523.1 hypothetical protein [Paucibacter sp. R3-3]